MIRAFLEFLLSRSLDDGSPPPTWLQRLVRRNPQLGNFRHEAEQLDEALRASATEHRQAMREVAAASTSVATLTLPTRPQHTAPREPQSGQHRKTIWLSGFATAAALFLAISLTWPRTKTPEVHAGDFSQQLAVVPGEVLRVLNQAAETSQSNLPQLTPLASLSMPRLPNWNEVALRVESPMRQELDTWQQSWQNLKSRLPMSGQDATTQEL